VQNVAMLRCDGDGHEYVVVYGEKGCFDQGSSVYDVCERGGSDNSSLYGFGGKLSHCFVNGGFNGFTKVDA